MQKGEAYVAQTCAKCHTTSALRAFAAKLDDPKVLQQMWLMPGSGGRGFGPNTAPIPRPPITAIVTMPSGERLEGRVEHIDDFGDVVDERRSAAHDKDLRHHGQGRAARSTATTQGTATDLHGQRHPQRHGLPVSSLRRR